MSPLYPFVDLALARRLETAEGRANVGFVEARACLDTSAGATWMTAGGTLAMFDGPGSPMTQTFGLGIHEPVDDDTLDTIEWFFRSRGASVCHEVSPLAGVEVYARLRIAAARGCDLAMMVAAPGSASQRNAERQGFRIAYTRVKWELIQGTGA